MTQVIHFHIYCRCLNVPRNGASVHSYCHTVWSIFVYGSCFSWRYTAVSENSTAYHSKQTSSYGRRLYSICKLNIQLSDMLLLTLLCLWHPWVLLIGCAEDYPTMHYLEHPVNDSIWDFDCVFPAIPVSNCIMGILLTCPYYNMHNGWYTTGLTAYLLYFTVHSLRRVRNGGNSLRGRRGRQNVFDITSDTFSWLFTDLLQVRKWKMHLFTFIQLLCVGVLWAVKSSPAALGFPFVLILLVPFRFLILKYIFTQEELNEVSYHHYYL